MIKQLEHLPQGLLNLNANQLYTKIENHTLIHLKGRIQRPAFISILQHGNEHTGWDALKDYLNNHQHVLPRSLSILFGNIDAARHNVRRLDNQTDFNRAWPSHLNLTTPLANTMREITDIMRAKKPFASVDIHNNTGRNPHYSGINKLETEYINLASLFSDTMVYFTTPIGIQSTSFAEFCPSVTVECGLSGTSDGKEQTHTFLELLLSQSNLKQVPGIVEHQRVYKIKASVKVKPEIPISFNPLENGLRLVQDLDYLNFKKVDINEPFACFSQKTTDNQNLPFVVENNKNQDITSEYFYINNNKLVCKKSFVPAMITQSIKAIRQDCLCYIMQPITLS